MHFLKRLLAGNTADGGLSASSTGIAAANERAMGGALEHALDAIVVIDGSNHIVFLNRAAEQLWGVSRDEVMGENVKVLVPSEHRSQHDEYVDHHRTTGENKIVGTKREVEVERRDGTRTWVNLALTEVDIGGTKGYMAVVRDISEQRRRREEINQTLRQAIDAVVTIDEENRVTFFNPAAERLWGYSQDEVLGNNVRMLVPRIHQSEHDNYINRNRRTGQNLIVGTSRELQLETKDGRSIWVAFSLSKIDIDDRIVYTAFVRDISAERRQREEIDQTLAQAIDAVVTIDENNNVTFFNAAAEKLWGYRREQVMGQNVRMLVPRMHQSLHDDYIDRNRRTGENRIVGTSRELLMETADGHEIWVAFSLSKVEIDGRIAYTAFVRDITAERESRESVQQTLGQALDAVVTIDEHNNVTFFNSAAEKLWGYTPEEVLGRNVKMLVPVAMQADHDSYVNGNRVTGRDRIVGTRREVPIHRKDGSERWGLLSLSKVQLDDKIHYTAFLRDVTVEVAQRREMERIMVSTERSSEEVASISTEITDIAAETKVLALNATLEAAKAKEFGRGFGVVATEVRELAARTADSAGQISQLSDDSTQMLGQLHELLRKSEDQSH